MTWRQAARALVKRQGRCCAEQGAFGVGVVELPQQFS
jgi:hypothetical protein